MKFGFFSCKCLKVMSNRFWRGLFPSPPPPPPPLSPNRVNVSSLVLLLLLCYYYYYCYYYIYYVFIIINIIIISSIIVVIIIIYLFLRLLFYLPTFHSFVITIFLDEAENLQSTPRSITINHLRDSSWFSWKIEVNRKQYFRIHWLLHCICCIMLYCCFVL